MNCFRPSTRSQISSIGMRLLFFFYPYIEATWGLVERPLFAADGSIKNVTDSMPALGAGLSQAPPGNLKSS